MMTSDKAIEILQKKIDAIKLIDDRMDFNNWKRTTISTLLNLYKEDDVRLVGLMSIKPYIPNTYTSGGTDVLTKAKSMSKVYLEGLIEDLKVFGVPMDKISSSSNAVNVNVNQQNHQSQTTNITLNLEIFADAIKDELKGGQLKEYNSPII